MQLVIHSMRVHYYYYYHYGRGWNACVYRLHIVEMNSENVVSDDLTTEKRPTMPKI